MVSSSSSSSSSTLHQIQSSLNSSYVLSFQLFPHTGKEEENDCLASEDEDYSVRSSKRTGIKDEINKEKVYIHPLVKLSSSKLSMKSLEMCTESLGSESGSEVGENDDHYHTIMSYSFKGNERDKAATSAVSACRVAKKAKQRERERDGYFPPPLTSSIRGFRMESRREDGRLVLTAVPNYAPRSRYFHAERSHGRLRLQLLQQNQEHEDGEKDGKNGDEEMGKLGRPCNRRCNCKEGSRMNWEPVWVST